MLTLVAFLFALAPGASADGDVEQVAKNIETRWIDDRNADHGAHGWPAGYGLSPERYILEAAPAPSEATDHRFEDLGHELGRNLYVAFSLYRGDHRQAFLNERKHIGKILARFNLLLPAATGDQYVFTDHLVKTIVDHLTRAARLAGVDVAEASYLLFHDLEFGKFTEANLKQATKQVRAQWRTASDSAHTWRYGRYLPSEAWALRWAQYAPIAAVTLISGYLLDGLIAEHRELEFTVWGMATVVGGGFVAKYVLPYTPRMFKQRKDVITPALKGCQALLASPRDPA